MALLTNSVHSFRRRLIFSAMGAGLLALTACTTVDTGKAPPLDRDAAWALLPFSNHTETPQAGLRAEAIAESLLRTSARLNLKRYPVGLNTETLFEPSDRKQYDAALAWARSQGVQYAVTGNVDEWRYKVGIDGEPAAGLTMQVVDVQSGNVLWSGAGGKTGWSREALSAVAQKLMRELLAPVAASVR